jgi:DNA-binding beta-propeller fold protein YncE
VFAHTVTDQGTGAGTVDDPTGIDVDYNGNIYYSQTGEYFKIHKIRKVSGSNNYPSVFDNGMNEIMDLYRFSSPTDVAVDNNQFVYVANTEAQEVQVFDSNGEFFLKAGIETFIVDTTMQVIHGPDTVVVDTFITIEEKGFLVEPSAITVDDRGIVYICDTITGRILRYRLSNQLDEDLQPIP